LEIGIFEMRRTNWEYLPIYKNLSIDDVKPQIFNDVIVGT